MTLLSFGYDKKYYTEQNSWRNFTQLLSKVGTYGQVGDYLMIVIIFGVPNVEECIVVR